MILLGRRTLSVIDVLTSEARNVRFSESLFSLPPIIDSVESPQETSHRRSSWCCEKTLASNMARFHAQWNRDSPRTLISFRAPSRARGDLLNSPAKESKCDHEVIYPLDHDCEILTLEKENLVLLLLVRGCSLLPGCCSRYLLSRILFKVINMI